MSDELTQEIKQAKLFSQGLVDHLRHMGGIKVEIPIFVGLDEYKVTVEIVDK